VEDIAQNEAAGQRIEIWFQDEARIGQKNKITRRWAERGTRPVAAHDQRTASAYICGAICPQDGPFDRLRRRGSRFAALRHRGDEPASGRDRHHGGARSACRAAL
jgi:hypothetical protein